MEQTVQVEFTDRYDGRPPSWLRGCFECEAMGSYPVKAHVAGDPAAVSYLSNELTPYERAIIEQKIANGKREEDGWYVVHCLACEGTARVSWLTTVLRIPRWIRKGVRLMFVEAPSFCTNMSYPAAVWLGFKCAFLADLGLWRP